MAELWTVPVPDDWVCPYCGANDGAVVDPQAPSPGGHALPATCVACEAIVGNVDQAEVQAGLDEATEGKTDDEIATEAEPETAATDDTGEKDEDGQADVPPS